jgi:hypothetical protein
MEDMEDDEFTESLWYSTEGGRNLGRPGIEGGYIQRDEELGDPLEPEDAQARITLEQKGIDDPLFYVTAQLYGGWLFLTVGRKTKTEAEAIYTKLRAELERLASLLPFEEEPDIEIRATQVATESAALESRFARI